MAWFKVTLTQNFPNKVQETKILLASCDINTAYQRMNDYATAQGYPFHVDCQKVSVMDMIPMNEAEDCTHIMVDADFVYTK